MAPELTDVPLTSFCSTPLTRTVTALLRHTMSYLFHSPTGFSELGWRWGKLLAWGFGKLAACAPPLSRTSPALPESSCASRQVGQTRSAPVMCRKTPLFPGPDG